MCLIVTNGLLFSENQSVENKAVLHPSVLAWQKQLEHCSKKWFHCAAKNPLGWYAVLCETSPAALLAQHCDALPEDMSQCWVVSPYHAQLVRTAVRVMPEGQFAWTAEDAHHLCATLNPLLAEEGMQLFAVGAALLLSCREPIDAWPMGFGEISGHSLPDRNHAGEDGGRLNRLLSEIQMLLFQHPLQKRQERGEPDVSGLWFWSPIHEPVQSHIKQIAVATRNPALQSVVNGKDADVMITEAERLSELVQQGSLLPKRVLLAGEGYAVVLTKSILPRFGQANWNPGRLQTEQGLLTMLHTQFGGNT